MNYETLEHFRRKLLRRKLWLLRQEPELRVDESELRAEREPDWEDVAAIQTAAAALESLGEAERGELARIQAALRRMERGSYGECSICRGGIDLQRLEAVPDTDRCGRCAAAL